MSPFDAANHANLDEKNDDYFAMENAEIMRILRI